MIQQDEQRTYEPSSLSYDDSRYTSASFFDTLAHLPVTSDSGSGQIPEVPLSGFSNPPQRPKRSKAVLLLIVLLLIFVMSTGVFAGWAFAEASSNTTSKSSEISASSSSTSTSTLSEEAQQEAAIAKVEPGVVEVLVTTSSGEQLGSGVIIDAKGDIVTNNHVISGEQSISVVLSNGKTEQAQLVGSSASNDLAVVRIAPFTNMTVVPIGNSSKLVVGEEVLAIGNPLGNVETVTKGIVSALNRSVQESTGATLTSAVQTDAAVNPGNSGGALINLQGQLIGIPTLTAINTETNTAANGVSFAISSNTLQTVVAQLLQQ